MISQLCKDLKNKAGTYQQNLKLAENAEAFGVHAADLNGFRDQLEGAVERYLLLRSKDIPVDLTKEILNDIKGARQLKEEFEQLLESDPDRLSKDDTNRNFRNLIDKLGRVLGPFCFEAWESWLKGEYEVSPGNNSSMFLKAGKLLSIARKLDELEGQIEEWQKSFPGDAGEIDQAKKCIQDAEKLQKKLTENFPKELQEVWVNLTTTSQGIRLGQLKSIEEHLKKLELYEHLRIFLQ